MSFKRGQVYCGQLRREKIACNDIGKVFSTIGKITGGVSNAISIFTNKSGSGNTTGQSANITKGGLQLDLSGVTLPQAKTDIGQFFSKNGIWLLLGLGLLVVAFFLMRK